MIIIGALLLAPSPIETYKEEGKIEFELAESLEDIRKEKFEELVEEVLSTRKKEEKISAEATVVEKVTMSQLPVCAPLTNVVTYMDYRSNKNPKAPQTQIQRTGNVVTAKDGTRYTNGRLHVAMARQYGNIGDKLILNLEGKIVPALLVEWKGNTTCQHPDGSMLELVVDSTVGTNFKEYQKRIISIQKEE